MEPAVYTSIEIIDEFVHRVEEDPHDENSVKAMTSGILSYYFPLDKGVAVTAISNPDGRSADSMMLRVRRFLPGTRTLVDFGIVQADWGVDSQEKSLERLGDGLANFKEESKLCWAILLHGCEFHFYHYDPERQEEKRFVPWSHSAQKNSFHARSDRMEIHRVIIQITREENLPQSPNTDPALD